MIKLVQTLPAWAEANPVTVEVATAADIFEVDFVKKEIEKETFHRLIFAATGRLDTWILQAESKDHIFTMLGYMQGGAEEEYAKVLTRMKDAVAQMPVPAALKEAPEYEVEFIEGDIVPATQRYPDGQWLIMSMNEGGINGRAFWSMSDGWVQKRAQASFFTHEDRLEHMQDLPAAKENDAQWVYVIPRPGYTKHRADPVAKIRRRYLKGSRGLKTFLLRQMEAGMPAEEIANIKRFHSNDPRYAHNVADRRRRTKRNQRAGK